jgi:hypothetical protein
MDDSRRVIAAMAAKCRDTIRASDEEDSRLPPPLHPKHLLWMCEQVVEHGEKAKLTKLHRWIGFVQAGMLANRMLTLEQIKHLFDQMKEAQCQVHEDLDLADHLNVADSFAFELGGQG